MEIISHNCVLSSHCSTNLSSTVWLLTGYTNAGHCWGKVEGLGRIYQMINLLKVIFESLMWKQRLRYGLEEVAICYQEWISLIVYSPTEPQPPTVYSSSMSSCSRIVTFHVCCSVPTSPPCNSCFLLHCEPWLTHSSALFWHVYALPPPALFPLAVKPLSPFCLSTLWPLCYPVFHFIALVLHRQSTRC